MIEVFKIIHNYYDTGASVKLNFNPVGSTRGNIRKYSFCYRVVNVWNRHAVFIINVSCSASQGCAGSRWSSRVHDVCAALLSRRQLPPICVQASAVLRCLGKPSSYALKTPPTDRYLQPYREFIITNEA